jgi:hypothetical protein
LCEGTFGRSVSNGQEKQQVTRGVRASASLWAGALQLKALGPNAVLIALAISAVCIIVVSLLTKNVAISEKVVSEGNRHL